MVFFWQQSSDQTKKEKGSKPSASTLALSIPSSSCQSFGLDSTMDGSGYYYSHGGDPGDDIVNSNWIKSYHDYGSIQDPSKQEGSGSPNKNDTMDDARLDRTVDDNDNSNYHRRSLDVVPRRTRRSLVGASGVHTDDYPAAWEPPDGAGMYDDDYKGDVIDGLGLVSNHTHHASSNSCRGIIQWWCLATILLVVLVLLVLSVFVFGLPIQMGRYQALTTTTPSAVEYDYIVVGSGPSGIIAATELARRFPDTRVLMVESGTTSQAQVLETLQQQQQQQRVSLPRKDDNRIQSRGDLGTGMAQSSFLQFPSTWFSSATTTTTMSSTGVMDSPTSYFEPRWNAFDVPLMWTGVASRSFDAAAARKLTPQHHWPLPNRSLLVGRALGGSAVHNAMIYVRLLPRDVQRWNLTNGDGEPMDGDNPQLLWNYSILLHHYMELEHYFAPVQRDPYYWSGRGRSGPITTQRADPDLYSGGGFLQVDPVAQPFVQAAAAAGFGLAGDGLGFNAQQHELQACQFPKTATTSQATAKKACGGSRLGGGYYEFNIRPNGIRDSVARSFIHSAAKPSNLHIVTGQSVTRILFAQNSNITGREWDMGKRHLFHATGIEYVALQLDGHILFGQYALRPCNTCRDDRSAAEISGASSQIIVAAGALMTPQLLFNSGRSRMTGLDVEASGTSSSSHLPMLPSHLGYNLQDHPAMAMAFALNLSSPAATSNSVYSLAAELQAYLLAAQSLNQKLNQRNQTYQDSVGMANNSFTEWTMDPVAARHWREQLGKLGTPGFSSGAFLRSPFIDPDAAQEDDDDSPDLQLTVFPRVMEPHAVQRMQTLLAHHNEHGSSHIQHALNRPTMLVTIALLRPQARYRVQPARVQSSETISPTRVYNMSEMLEQFVGLPTVVLPEGRTEYLTEFDIQRLVWGMEQVRTILETPPLSKMTAGEIYPGFGTNLSHHVRLHHLPNSHWAGSARMGIVPRHHRHDNTSHDHGESGDDDDDDDDSSVVVVDATTMRVRGMANVRVVDASVLPFIPNGNTHSTVCVVARQAAAIIATERKQSNTQ